MKTPATVAATPPNNPLTGLARAWDRFWFSPMDPTLLGLIRICCGLVTLYLHLAYTVDLQEFFGARAWVDTQALEHFRREFPWIPASWDWDNEEPVSFMKAENPAEAEYMKRWSAYGRENDAGRQYGFNPRQVFTGYYSWSIWYHVTDPTWMWIVHGSILLIMFLFTIGLCTRITSVLTWLGALSYINRGPTNLFGQDTMMNLLLIYLMIGPSGAALSVDRLLRRYWGERRALRAHKPVPALQQPAPRVSANVAIRLIQVNLCVIYLASGLSKLRGSSWWDGTALWGTLANWEFSPFDFAPFYAFLRFICEHRLLWEIVLSGSVVFTFFVEIGFPFLVWNRRLCWLMVSSAVAMHTGIALSMGLKTFSMMMMIMAMSFVPQEAVHRLLRKLGRGRSHLQQALRASLGRPEDARRPAKGQKVTS